MIDNVTFQRCLAVDQRGDDVAVMDFFALLENHDVAIEDVRPDVALSGRPDSAARMNWNPRGYYYTRLYVDAVRAVQLNHLYPFNDTLVSRPGPRIVDGLEQLARLLHPKVFT